MQRFHLVVDSLGRGPIALVMMTLALSVAPAAAEAQGLRLRDICRLKGQETNTLQGLGLVVGLRGTGDPTAGPTSRALARMMQLMGAQMQLDARGQLMLNDLGDAKNVALVFVTASVPPVGAQQGDRIDLKVNAINAKSLEGGYLMLTPLLGPRADQSTVYAMAEGPLRISADAPPTTATVEQGAKMEATIQAPFHRDGRVTLILERDFADFNTAQRIEEEINDMPDIALGALATPDSSARAVSARAIDPLHIEVDIPKVYLDNPIKFISMMLDIPVQVASKSTRVVINEREGVVIIGEEVELAPSLVTHRNLRIEAGNRQALVALDPQAEGRPNPKLKNLADALNALDVPAEDLIIIIKSLKAKGDLYGEVIFQ